MTAFRKKGKKRNEFKYLEVVLAWQRVEKLRVFQTCNRKK